LALFGPLAVLLFGFVVGGQIVSALQFGLIVLPQRFSPDRELSRSATPLRYWLAFAFLVVIFVGLVALAITWTIFIFGFWKHYRPV
jgi:hypothetical protein